ncbi:uncharacterized protein LOC132035385 isoform X2 [Lycium ferocissimum]|uniref:uncharacterized protein LOC132035385 isoform X2 n=1 Tax=Lycium ferocissimum TaxID=112874 RepID=UPI002814AE46|nr:uncharacterized protein LOC132035385 isoform X2 [Lycium ferocissimum]
MVFNLRGGVYSKDQARESERSIVSSVRNKIMSFPTGKADNSTQNETSSVIQDDQIRRAQLKVQFDSTRKGDLETVESYMKKLKSIAISLAEINSPVSDSDMVLQLLTGLPSEYSPVKKISPLPNFEKACLLVSMQERILKDYHEEQNASDPRVGGEEESSPFVTLEKVATIVGIASTIMGAVATFTTVAGAVGAVSAVSASRMIAIGSMSAVGAVAGWKIWQTQKKSD